MLPIYPLDGGRIAKSTFINYFGKKGQLYSGLLSLLLSTTLLIYSVITLDWILIFFSLLFILFSYYELKPNNELNKN